MSWSFWKCTSEKWGSLGGIIVMFNTRIYLLFFSFEVYTREDEEGGKGKGGVGSARYVDDGKLGG